MINQPAAHLVLDVERDNIPAFFPLLQHGFMVNAQAGRSLKRMLCDQFNISSDYVDNRISTIFIDGKPVDDTDSAIIKDGSRIALSAAMPGLAGATFRKGGYLASFRETITYQEEDKVESYREGVVLLKLFNLLIKELGPTFLAQGVLIKKDDLEKFFKDQTDDFWAGCNKAKLDGKKIGLDQVQEISWPDAEGPVLLRVDHHLMKKNI